LPLWLLSWAAAALLPGAGLLLVPLQALPLALGLAWNLLDYPLTLHGVRVRERWALLRRAPLSILGFGFCLAAVSMIPGAALLLLPAGVVGATDLVAGLLPLGGHILKTTET
jgi:CysZ protein